MFRYKITALSLMELIAVLAITAILAAVAIPGYQSHIKESRRQHAINLLYDLKYEVENFKLKNGAYPSSSQATSLITTVSTDSEATKYYSLSYSTGTNSYTLTATATGDQTGDSGCTTLSINQSSDQISPVSCRQ